jgi:biotin transport system substrate-specific component
MSTIPLGRWRTARYQAFRWRDELGILQKLGLALAMAGLTGLLAQVRIPLPWTPVAITGQAFAVLMAAVMLGAGWGGISMVLYVGLGAAGLPWFQVWQGGWGYLAGPTGGYLIGFILAAFLIGHITDKYVKFRQFPALLAVMTAAYFVMVYVPGLLQLNIWLNAAGKPVGFGALLNLGLVPFILVDLIKIVLAAALAWGLTPKENFFKG